MDRRQGRKIGYLVLANLAEQLANGQSVNLDDALNAAGVSVRDFGTVENGVRSIALSLRQRGQDMNATGGGGTADISSIVRTLLPTVANSQLAPVVASAPSAPSLAPVSTAPSTHLLYVTDGQLESLVTAQVDNFVSSSKTFTAFDVTSALRNTNPTLNIGHERVRSLVHYIMNGNNEYEQTVAYFNGNPAIQWAPVQAVASSTIPTTSTTSAGGLSVSWISRLLGQTDTDDDEN